MNHSRFNLCRFFTHQGQLILAVVVFLATWQTSWAAEGKLLATPGVFQVEGAGGGGLVPWAQLGGYATEDEIAATAFCSRAQLDEFDLSVCGAGVNFYDRTEITLAQQRFGVLPLKLDIQQNIYGLKTRLLGDLVYGDWPQISLGLQHKSLQDGTVAYLLGAQKDSGTDIYLAASRLHLGALAGFNAFWNITLRASDANQMGLLGFGAEHSQRSINAEAAAAIFLNRHLALGTEYRQKPNNLTLREDDWQDVFIAWFPNKSCSLTLAWINLGTIAAVPEQTGWYLSLGGYW